MLYHVLRVTLHVQLHVQLHVLHVLRVTLHVQLYVLHVLRVILHVTPCTTWYYMVLHGTLQQEPHCHSTVVTHVHEYAIVTRGVV